MGFIEDIFKPASPEMRTFLNMGGVPSQFDDYKAGKVTIYGTPINANSAYNAYGVPLDAMDNSGLYGQLEMQKQFAQAENGGLFGFLSEVAFGNKPPAVPKSVAEGLFGGSIGDELGKTIKPLALPLAVVAGLYLFTRGKI